MSWTLEQIVAATNGKVLSTVTQQFNGVGTDTRDDLSGQLFIALRGHNFDAHQFVEQALLKGAVGLLVHTESEATKKLSGKMTIVLVPDTLKALQGMAQAYRQRIGFKVIGISGSNGKTTTKEFSRDILKQKFRVHASHGSFNNQWGVPLTILSAPADTEIVIQEMGMSHLGELAALSKIAEPNVVVVTTVGRAHIGELGSQEAIAKAKEELYACNPWAIGVFNLDNEFTIPMYDRSKTAGRNKMFTFSAFRDGEVDVSMRANHVWLSEVEIIGRINKVDSKCKVSVSGRHNVINLMAASCVGLALGLTPEEIWQALPNLKTTWGRGQLLTHPVGTTIIFDGYNANPDSSSVMLRNMMEVEASGRKFAILGEMLELGSQSGALHQELGEIAGGANLNEIWFIGEHAKDFEKGLAKTRFAGRFHKSEKFDEGLAKYFQHKMQKNDVVVIKGSRGAKMEQVLANWGMNVPKP